MSYGDSFECEVSRFKQPGRRFRGNGPWVCTCRWEYCVYAGQNGLFRLKAVLRTPDTKPVANIRLPRQRVGHPTSHLKLLT